MKDSGRNRGATWSKRADEIYVLELGAHYKRIDRMFLWLMLAQWIFAIGVALVWSPFGWSGKVRTVHEHVKTALFVGAALTTLPALLILTRPSWWLTRHVVAAAQMLWSALLIHLSGGRIETHFHVFGSLAFVAFYRDWKLLPTATVAVAADHLVRGILWPESVYGIPNPEWWRFLEHAFWVAFEDIVLIYSCVRGSQELASLTARQAEVEEVSSGIERQVEERTAELAASRGQFQQLVETVNVVPYELELESLGFTYVGPQAERLLGYPGSDWRQPGFFQDRLHIEDRARVVAAVRRAVDGGRGQDLEYRLMARDGRVAWVRNVLTVGDQGGRPVLRGMILDQTDRKRLEDELQQAQKLESVGRLASGIAHEINTPIQFVGDSVHFVRDATKDLSTVVVKYRELRAALAGDPSWAERAREIAASEEAADVDYLMENVPLAIERSLDGLGRVAAIVRSMKEFAHPDRREQAPADLNRAVESTLTIARNEYKLVADVETEFGEVPPVTCHLGELNQVVLNIVVNAAHAIADRNRGSGQKGLITVRTSLVGSDAVIAIGDTGGGIPPTIRERIFDPFFTTKEVGRGTGQGLAIARTAIVDKHGGTLTFETEVGKGTTFYIRLPIAGKPGAAAAA